MRDNYDFSDAVKNPFAGKIKDKYTVLVTYDLTQKDGEGDTDSELSPDALAAFEEYLASRKAQ